jgi:hypothetical protein
VTHPFHPLFGRQFEFVARRRNWGEDRVYFHDESGELGSLPTAWTDMADADPVGARKSAVRAELEVRERPQGREC